MRAQRQRGARRSQRSSGSSERSRPRPASTCSTGAPIPITTGPCSPTWASRRQCWRPPRPCAGSLRRIDMRNHEGAHPRMGAVDVIPFVPLRGVTDEEAVALARRLGEWIGEQGVPVYYYQEAATRPGAAVAARRAAGRIRGPCGQVGHSGGSARRRSGGVQRPLGRLDRGSALPADRLQRQSGHQRPRQWPGASPRRCAFPAADTGTCGPWEWRWRTRVRCRSRWTSCTTRRRPIHRVLETVRSEAARYGVAVAGCELVGLAPLEAFDEAIRHYLQTARFLRGARSSRAGFWRCDLPPEERCTSNPSDTRSTRGASSGGDLCPRDPPGARTAATPCRPARPRWRSRTLCATCRRRCTRRWRLSSWRNSGSGGASTATGSGRAPGDRRRSGAGRRRRQHQSPAGGPVSGHPRGPGAPAQHRQQPRLRRRPLSLRARHLWRDGPGVPELDAVPAGQAVPGADDRKADPGGRLRPPGGSVPQPSRRPPGDQHQRPHGGRVRQPGRLPRGRPAGRGQLRPDDGRRLDVHRAPGDRARHLSDAC